MFPSSTHSNMNGYSKMSAAISSNYTSKAERSSEFSPDLTLSPPKKHAGTEETHHHGNQLSVSPWQEQQGGEKLSKSRSTASQRFRSNGYSNESSVQDVLKRAFSLRKSSSVHEGYWRIDDAAADGHGEWEIIEEESEQQMKGGGGGYRKKRSKIFRACKRLFGF